MSEFEKFSLIVQVAGVVATTAAVIVALYLATRERKVLLKVVTGKYERYQENVGNLPSVFSIQVKNLGFSPVTITGFAWQAGFFRKTTGLQFFDKLNEYNTQLPKEINYGESIRMHIPWDDLVERIFPSLAKNLGSRIFLSNRNFLRIMPLVTVAKKDQGHPVDDSIRKEFIRIVNGL